MWPFAVKNDDKPQLAIEERLVVIERHIKALEIDWEDTYDRIRKVLQRLNKRAEFIEKHDPELIAPVGNGPQTPRQADRTPIGGFLSDRQREIQQQILRRRGGS
jgi:hypothetical protein